MMRILLGDRVGIPQFPTLPHFAIYSRLSQGFGQVLSRIKSQYVQLLTSQLRIKTFAWL